MGNPDDDDKTVINVKAVRKPAWEAARRGAAQTGDSMGTWLSDAIEQRVASDAGQVKPPGKHDGKPGNPAALSPDQLTARIMAVAALQQSTAAIRQATGKATGLGVLHRSLASLDQHMTEAEGLPARPARVVGKAPAALRHDAAEAKAEPARPNSAG